MIQPIWKPKVSNTINEEGQCSKKNEMQVIHVHVSSPIETAEVSDSEKILKSPSPSATAKNLCFSSTPEDITIPLHNAFEYLLTYLNLERELHAMGENSK